MSDDLGVLDHDPYVVLDPRFAECVVAGGKAERLWTGGTWVEGPVWFDDWGHLIWSDIPNNRMLRWDEVDGRVTLFRQPALGANGNTQDRDGRLVTCEGSARRITRTEKDGGVTVLATGFQGKRFNAPNDVVVRSDGTIWFTDPSYGGPDYQGSLEMDGCHVYRLDPATGTVTRLTQDMVMPNGLAFSLDETELFVVDTGSSLGPGNPNHIRRFGVNSDATLSGGAVFCTSTAQAFDGIRFDAEHRLWCSESDGAHCYAMDGTLIGKVLLPEPAANLCFGGGAAGSLFITATTSLYRVPVNTHRP